MIGDFYAGNPISFGANATLDRLFVFANDLDVPLVLPAGGSTLTIAEPGPVGIYASSLISIQDIQTLLRAARVGNVNDNAALKATQTVSQIQIASRQQLLRLTSSFLLHQISNCYADEIRGPQHAPMQNKLSSR